MFSSGVFLDKEYPIRKDRIAIAILVDSKLSPNRRVAIRLKAKKIKRRRNALFLNPEINMGDVMKSNGESI